MRANKIIAFELGEFLEIQWNWNKSAFFKFKLFINLEMINPHLVRNCDYTFKQCMDMQENYTKIDIPSKYRFYVAR